jgi:hypothetical protein
MSMPHVCPDLARYQSLAAGLLSSGENETLLSHLAGCDSCVQRLEGLWQKDTLVELIRQAQTEGDPPDAETVARLVEQLRKLRPSAEAEGLEVCLEWYPQVRVRSVAARGHAA